MCKYNLHSSLPANSTLDDISRVVTLLRSPNKRLASQYYYRMRKHHKLKSAKNASLEEICMFADASWGDKEKNIHNVATKVRQEDALLHHGEHFTCKRVADLHLAHSVTRRQQLIAKRSLLWTPLFHS